MKCLDKKRLKLKNGEKAAMNERNVLAQVLDSQTTIEKWNGEGLALLLQG